MHERRIRFLALVLTRHFLGGAELTSEHAVRETRNDGLERHVPRRYLVSTKARKVQHG